MTTTDHLGLACTFGLLTLCFSSLLLGRFVPGRGFWRGYAQGSSVAYFIFALCIVWNMYWPAVAEWMGW